MLKAKIPLYGLMFAIVTLLFLPSYAQAAVGDDLPARAVHSFRAEDFCLINENKGSSEQRTAILRSGIVAALGYAKNQDSSFLQAIEESAKRGNCSHLLMLGKAYGPRAHYEAHLIVFEETWLRDIEKDLHYKLRQQDLWQQLVADLKGIVPDKDHVRLTACNIPGRYPAGVGLERKKGFLRDWRDEPYENTPYLTERFYELRKLRLQAKYLEFSKQPNPWNRVGYEEIEAGRFANASLAFKACGSPNSLFNLGKMAIEGVGMEVDSEAAAQLFKQAATPAAYQALASLCIRGKIKFNPHEAVMWCEREDTSEAKFFLGKIYEEGKLGAPNFKKAAYWYREASTPDGWIKLGLLHASGKLGVPDFQEAAKLYRRAGTSNALTLLGFLYFNDSLKEKETFHRAKDCFIEVNTPEAMLFLGYLYAGENLGKPNYKLADQYYAQSPLPDAFCQRGVLEEMGRLGNKPNLEKAAAFYKQADTPEAWHRLACLIVKGRVEFLSFQEVARGLISKPSEEGLVMLLRMCNFPPSFFEQTPDTLSFIKQEALQRLLPFIETYPVARQNFVRGELAQMEGKEAEAFALYKKAEELGDDEASRHIYYIEQIKLLVQTLKGLESAPGAEEQGGAAADNIPLDDLVSDDEEESISSLETAKAAAVPDVGRVRKISAKIKKIKEMITQGNLSKNHPQGKQERLPVLFSDKTVEAHYQTWNADPKLGSRLRMLMSYITENPLSLAGPGKPESLRGREGGNLTFSRRLNQKDRIVYTKYEGKVLILSCGGHYDG